jgi:hypothetical protein
MQGIKQLEQDKRDLQEELKELKETKHKLLVKFILAIPILIFATFFITLIPLRGSGRSMSEIMGRQNSIFLTGTFYIIVFIWSANKEYNNYKNQKFDIEYDIERIESKIAKLKEKASI